MRVLSEPVNLLTYSPSVDHVNITCKIKKSMSILWILSIIKVSTDWHTKFNPIQTGLLGGCSDWGGRKQPAAGTQESLKIL